MQPSDAGDLLVLDVEHIEMEQELRNLRLKDVQGTCTGISVQRKLAMNSSKRSAATVQNPVRNGRPFHDLRRVTTASAHSAHTRIQRTLTHVALHATRTRVTSVSPDRPPRGVDHVFTPNC